VPLTDCGKRFFGSSDARIWPIEMILNVCDNLMCFDRERRIVLTEANLSHAWTDSVRSTGIAQWTSTLFRNVLVIGPHPCHMTNAEKVYMTRCRHGGEFPVSGSQECSPKGRRRDGRVNLQDAVPAQILRRVPWCARCLFKRERRRGRRRTGAGGHIQ
jgi:hypothetical protein